MATTTAMTTTNDSNQLTQMGEMSVASIVDRKHKLNQVMREVMTDGVHYGKIPGCGDKPTLHKAGAEVLATVFGLAPKFKIKHTNLPGGHREYEIVCTLKHIASNQVLGEGVGTCSTMESKYRWRRADRTCPKCGKSGALLKSKRPGEGFYCWTKKDGCGAQFAPGDAAVENQETGRAENPDIADTYNTVLKMAKKRAQVDATLTAVGASDILTQDLEDLQPREDAAAGPQVIGPVPASSASKPAAAKPAAKPAEPPKGLSEEEFENLMTAIGGFTSITELRKFGQEKLVPTAQSATGEQYKKLREAFEEQHDLIEQALANEAQQ